MQKVTRCFYHRDADGFAAACIVRHYFEGIQAPCDFQAVQYGEPLPLEDMQGKNIIFVDFSPKPEEIRAILQSCDDLKILDHHKTASYIQELVPGSVFDVSKSGAVLAWEEFFPNQPVPEFILYIQDRDLWQWKLPHSREVSAAVASYPMEFGSNWTSWIWGVSLEELRVEGAAILRYQQQQISRQIGNGVEMIHLAGYWAPAVL
jgi:oligoribonuclease NrnB/cAMP/cGMP phosphodiesterase (DHH superfamily)